MADEQTALTGGCNCGAVRYSIAGEPLAVAACHCTRCRLQSGATYSVNLVVKLSAMTVEGEMSEYDEPDTESGAPLVRQFCGKCGSPIRSLPSSTPKIIAVKAGTLDDPSPYPPSLHLFTRSKLAWVEIPEGMTQYETGPRA